MFNFSLLEGKAFLKRASAKRLLVNSSNQHEHSAWTHYGLGLQDANGALKSELIDLDISQATVDFAVDYSLHRRDDCVDQPPRQTNIHSKTCGGLFGHCKLDMHHSIVQSLVMGLLQLTVQKKLQAGTLIKLKIGRDTAMSSAERLPEGFFFLGALCKKPTCQVLAKARQCDSSAFAMVEAMDDNESSQNNSILIPVFTTSHMAIYQMVQDCGGDVSSMSISIYKCKFETTVWGIQELRVSTHGEPEHLSIKAGASGQTSNAKRKVDLPFGLKLEKKQRKKRKSKTQKHKASERAMRKSEVLQVFAADGNGDSDGSSNDLDNGSDSDSDPKSEDEEDDLFDQNFDIDSSDSDAEAGGQEAAAEELMVPTASAVAEARSVDVAFSEYKSDCKYKSAMAKACATGSSYFAKNIGFTEASLATSNRSMCYHCNDRIAKGTIRFTYFWNTLRPSRYVHDKCVIPFVTADIPARKEQAVDDFRRLSQKYEDLTYKDSAASILDQLLQL